MSSSECQQFPIIPPPTTANLVVKDGLYLVLELLWLLVVVVPSRLLLTFFRKLFPPPGKSLKGQVVIVTGAGRGLGQGLVMRFAEEGAKVAVVDIDKSSAIQTAKAIEDSGGVAKAYFTNVGSVEEIHQLQVSVAKDLGPLDVLVNNAGIIHIESIANVTEAEVRSVMEVNLFSHFWMAQEFLPGMKSRNSGHIVSICSMSALVGLGNGCAYTASKCGVNGFMDALRAELNSNPVNNIKTTTVLPYFINTSEYYVNQWDIRLPPLSTQEVVETIVAAVKMDEVILSVPKTMYLTTNLIKLLPIDIRDRFYSTLYCRMILPTKKNEDSDRSQCLIHKLTRKTQE